MSANIARSNQTQPDGSTTALGGGLVFMRGSANLAGIVVAGNQAIATNGAAAGGGVVTLSPIVVAHSAITGNVAQAVAGSSEGGGIAAGFSTYAATISVELDASTIAGNAARSNGIATAARGGGVHATGPIEASYSTISGNTTAVTGAGSIARGGGLAVTCGSSVTTCDVNLVASTVSGNQAEGGDGDGGGVAAAGGKLVAYNSTIAFNRAPGRGGGVIASIGATSKLIGTIVADNDAPSGADISLPLGVSGALNVIGERNLVVDASGSVALPSDTLHGDPKLLPLANNGGTTATHALAACSPAIDAGSNVAGLDHDQRLAPYARVSGSAADIGAFELQPDADRVFADGFEASPCP